MVQKYQHPTLKFYDNEPAKPKPTIIRGSNVKRKVKKNSNTNSNQQMNSPGPGDYSFNPTHKEVIFLLYCFDYVFFFFIDFFY